MDAQRMVEHLSLVVQVANGKIDLPDSVIHEQAERFKKIGLMTDRPIQRGVQNPILAAGLQPYVHASISISKQQLLEELRLMQAYFSTHGPAATRPHNIFGHLDEYEWLWFHYKHVMHHFMQFGVVPLAERLV